MVDRLGAMRVFARVARLESFSAASRELRISTTAASRQVGELEGHLGVKLLQRTTRRLRLTPVGADYLEQCERVLSDVDELEGRVRAGEAAVRGLLRVSAGVDLGREHLAPRLGAFMDAHPEVEVELSLSDRYVDLVADGFDLAIRTGPLGDSSLVARPLATSWLATVASGGYLAAHGHPQVPAELAAHSAILDTNLRGGRFAFDTPSGVVRVSPRARLAINSPIAARAFAIEGRGIAQVPHFLVAEALAAGELVSLFDDLPRGLLPIQAVYPARRHQSARARRYIEHCAVTFAGFEA